MRFFSNSSFLRTDLKSISKFYVFFLYIYLSFTYETNWVQLNIVKINKEIIKKKN